MSLHKMITSTTSRSKKRAGRGFGSGKGGHTAGRGTKGQKSRGGVKLSMWFEGGQLPMTKRMPMWRGKGRFKAINPAAEVSLAEIDNMSADTITLETLKLEKVIDKRFKRARIIKSGELNRKVTIDDLTVTRGAKAEIEQQGGKVVN